MKVSKAAKIWIDYHTTHSKKNTVRSYRSVIDRFCQQFGGAEINQVTPDNVLDFVNRFSNGNKPYTNRSAIPTCPHFSISLETMLLPAQLLHKNKILSRKGQDSERIWYFKAA